MKHAILLNIATALFLTAATAPAAEPAKDARCYELRVYYAADGKLDTLNARFREHTLKLFEKHGMTNIGYWMPAENSDHKLYYILAFPDRAARDASWKAFGADPEWKAVAAATEKDGRIVTKVESTILHATDFSPEIKPAAKKEPRVFELRTYTSTGVNLPRLLARFRDHTLALFKKHGMTSFGYWTVDTGLNGPVENTLVYLLAHKSQESAAASFTAFRADPAWIAAKAASEQAAGGSLTIPDGVKSLFLIPTDYSPTK